MNAFERPMPSKKDDIIPPPQQVEALSFHEIPSIPPQKILSATNEFIIHLKDIVEDELREIADPHERKRTQYDLQTIILFFQPLIGGGKFGYNLKATKLEIEDLPENVFQALNRLAHAVPAIHDELLEKPSLRVETQHITVEPYHLPYVMVQRALHTLARAQDTTTSGRVRASRVAAITGGYAERVQKRHDTTLPFPIRVEDITPERMMISAAQTADALDAYKDKLPKDVRHDLTVVQSFLRGMASPDVGTSKAADHEESKSVRAFFLKRERFFEHPDALDLEAIPQEIIEAASRLSFVNPEIQAIVLGHEVGKAHKVLMVQQEETSSIEHPHAFNPITLAALNTHRLQQEHMAGWDAIQKWDMLTDRPENDELIATLSHAEYAAVAEKLGMFEKGESGFWKRAWDVLNTPIGTMWSRRRVKRREQKQQQQIEAWVEKLSEIADDVRIISDMSEGESKTNVYYAGGTLRRTVEKKKTYESACALISHITSQITAFPEFQKKELVRALKELSTDVMRLMDQQVAQEMRDMPELDLKRGQYKGLSHWAYIAFRSEQAAEFADLSWLSKPINTNNGLTGQVADINTRAEHLADFARSKDIADAHASGTPTKMETTIRYGNPIAYAHLCEQYADVVAHWDEELAEQLRKIAREKRKIRPRKAWAEDRINIFELRDTITQNAQWMAKLTTMPHNILDMDVHDADDKERVRAILKRLYVKMPEKREEVIQHAKVIAAAAGVWAEYLHESNPETAADMSAIARRAMDAHARPGTVYNRVAAEHERFVRLVEAWLVSQELQKNAEQKRKAFDMHSLAEMAEVIIRRLLGQRRRVGESLEEETLNIGDYAPIAQLIRDVRKETEGSFSDFDMNQSGVIAHTMLMQITHAYEVMDPKQAKRLKEAATYVREIWFNFRKDSQHIPMDAIEQLPEKWKQAFIDFQWRANAVERKIDYKSVEKHDVSGFVQHTLDEMHLESLPDGSTIVSLTEKTTATLSADPMKTTFIRIDGDTRKLLLSQDIKRRPIVTSKGKLFAVHPTDGMPLITPDEDAVGVSGNVFAEYARAPVFDLVADEPVQHPFLSQLGQSTLRLDIQGGNIPYPHFVLKEISDKPTFGRFKSLKDVVIAQGRQVRSVACLVFGECELGPSPLSPNVDVGEITAAAANTHGVVVSTKAGHQRSSLYSYALTEDGRWQQRNSRQVDGNIKKIQLTPDGTMYLMIQGPSAIFMVRGDMHDPPEIEFWHEVRAESFFAIPGTFHDSQVLPDGKIVVAYELLGKPYVEVFDGQPT